MDDELKIRGLTQDEALAMCCDIFCRFPRELPKDALEDICDDCALAGFVIRSFEDRYL